MDKKIFGYIRVSTQEQNIDRQLVAMAPFNIPERNLYIDTQSGKDFDRPAYRQLIRKLRKGDLLIVKSIDRLGRSYSDVIEQWRVITKKMGVDIRVLDMPLLDTTYYKDLLGTFISDLVLQVMSFSAQMEREALRQRQAEGIAAAKIRGVIFGKKPTILPSNFNNLCLKWRDGELSAREVAVSCGLSLRSLYRKTKKLRSI